MYIQQISYGLGTLFRGIAYMTWLGKAQNNSNSLLLSNVFYVWFPLRMLEKWNNTKVSQKKINFVKKIAVQILIYPLIAICLESLFTEKGFVETINKIYQSSGFFGFFKGLTYKILIQMITFIDNFIFRENNNTVFGRPILWIVWQTISIPSVWGLERKCLSSITGVQNLESGSQGFLYFMLYLISENPLDLFREWRLQQNYRFIGG